MSEEVNQIAYTAKLSAIWDKLQSFLNSRYAIIALLLLGVLRVIIALLAYPVADGADASDYYLHAAYLAGEDIPVGFASFSPLFPILVAVSYFGLGNFGLLFIVQWLMSAGQGLLYFLGLRQYNPTLAFVIALAIIADTQMSVTFNFASSEPLYMFFLASAFCLLLVQIKRENIHRGHWGDILFAVTLVALALTRSVGRFIYLPFFVFFFLGTRNFWRTGLVIISYFVLSFGFNTSYNALYFKTETPKPITTNNLLIAGPLYRYDLLAPENGEASAILAEYSETCLEKAILRTACLIEIYGNRPAYNEALRSAFTEMLRSRPIEYAGFIFEGFTDFLRLTGQQLRGGNSPADVQCADAEARAERNLQNYLEADWLVLNISPEVETTLVGLIHDFSEQLCPPNSSNLTVRQFVDWVAFRYRSISRPRPYLWAAVLAILVLIFPRIRHLCLPLFVAAGLLSYHAAISAIILNIQERYVVVTNPFKTILVLSTIAAIIYAMGQGIQKLRQSSPTSS